MSWLEDIIIISSLMAACILFIIVIIIVKHILLGRFACSTKQQNKTAIYVPANVQQQQQQQQQHFQHQLHQQEPHPARQVTDINTKRDHLSNNLLLSNSIKQQLDDDKNTSNSCSSTRNKQRNNGKSSSSRDLNNGCQGTEAMTSFVDQTSDNYNSSNHNDDGGGVCGDATHDVTIRQSDHFKLTSTQQRRVSKFRQDTADDCQDPDPADVIDDITEKIRPMVKKAISCDSILSDLDGSTTEAVRLGQIELSVHYNRQTSELSLTIIQARDLERDDVRLFSAGGGSGGGGGVGFVGSANCGVDSFVQVSISPRNQGKFCTKLHKDTNCPKYQETFTFKVPGCEYQLQTVKIEVLSANTATTSAAAAVAAATTNDSLNATTKTLQQTPSTKTLGEAELRLGDLLSLTQPFKIWLNLHESNYKLPECGDILFSMSYLPTAERLTVIIIKARDLMWPAEIVVTECFVKVHLMQNNKRVQKKKTSCKRDERHPIFNESMTFMVPATSLQSLQLRVSVIANLSPGASVGPTHPGSTYQVGHVTVGSKASGTELVHWNQTLNSLRKQTSMWHRLKK